MKRFEFSLERVLKVKRQQEKLAELEVQRARELVEIACNSLRSLQDQLNRLSEEFAAAVGSTMTPTRWSSASDMADRIGQSIRLAEQEVAAAESRLHAASQERAQVCTEVEALATLRQQRWEQWRAEAQKADQDRLDEVGLRLWQAARDEDAA